MRVLEQEQRTKVVIKKETTELDNKIKLLKLKMAKTEEILEQLRLSISSLASAVDELKN